MSVRIEEATSEASLHYLFMQVVNKAIHDSKNPTAPTEPADQEAAFYRIEQLGFQVGQRLLLQCLHRTAPSTRLPQQIDQIKFLCKDFWQAVFGKTIDNLKTNHRGVFVLQDRSFDWIARFSADASATETARMAVLVSDPFRKCSLATDLLPRSTWPIRAAC